VRALRAALLMCAVGSSAIASPPHHVDGGFRNVPEVARAGIDVTLPFFARRVWATITGRDGAAPLVANDGVFLRDNARHSAPTVTWIGHATVLVQMDGVTFLTDPIWSERASPFDFAGPKRFQAPGVALAALPPIDFVVVSHSHYDHTDLPTLKALAATGARIFVPLELGRVLRSAGITDVEELDWWEHRDVGRVKIHCVPAQHWSARSLFDKDETLWSGWAVVGPTRRFYFAGDTGPTASFAVIGERLGPFQLAALPIGAYEPAAMMGTVHMNPEQAVAAAGDLRAERVLGVHWGTFDLTDEPIDEPPRRFRAAADAAGLGAERAWVLAVGESRRW